MRGFAGHVIATELACGPACTRVRAGLIGIAERRSGESFACGGITGYVAVAEFCGGLRLAGWPLGDIAAPHLRCAPGITRVIACDCCAAELAG